jgi:streptomycin 3"-adenylyltransferase
VAIGDDAYRQAETFAARLAGCCAAAFGAQIVSAIVHGSLTMGDFAPARSDVDVLVVVARALRDAELDALRRCVGPLSETAPRNADLRVVTRAVAAGPTPAPAMEAYVEMRLGRPAEIETRVAGEPDLAVELSVVRAHGRAIVGAEPRTVVGDVPDAWIWEIGDRQLAAWERLIDDAAHDELMVLTTCRIWRFHAEAVHCSKSAAGRWALARDPSLTAVAAALRRRGGDPEARIEPADIGRLIATVQRERAGR